ncbi:dTDP-4-dehydrorhamnose reductase [Filobacillus milosensis]|uniref:dTDP-4-dehydrorhamnose reductase n=1 Tax=Filobacillus milosensis TaxID=94137 RepID=A0A4Y8IHL6_9BACI|nr:dTDP-4-dehydrorhamnose reductase [Filobacillus milosensis]TFB14183.1 dTDP-4-dehydrorhamnose reductase [Filobacillus milosensis]
MKVLVTGYNGQLGYDVVREARKRNISVIGVTRNDFDITNENDVKSYIYKVNPTVIIHCAAYTAVDQAEDNKEICWDVNVNGTKYMAEAAKLVNAQLMYISTDYVFDGNGNTPLRETDSTDPTGYYGLTKYEGEQIVKELLDLYFVVRISWVFGINGNNFIKTMLKLSETHNELSVVNDQYGSPTYTFDLARLLIDMIQTNKHGIYHASNEGFCSWAELAMEIFKQSNINTVVKPITTEEFPTRATRPKNSRMSKEKLMDKGFVSLPNWQDAVKRYLNELEEV